MDSTADNVSIVSLEITPVQWGTPVHQGYIKENKARTQLTTRDDETMTYYIATLSDVILYGTDADAVHDAAQRHDFRSNAHSVEKVSEGELSHLVSADYRTARRVYTDEEKRGRPDLENA